MNFRRVIIIALVFLVYCTNAQGPVNSCTLSGAMLHQQNPLAGCGNGSNYCNIATLFVPAYSPTACGTFTVGTTGTSTQTYSTKVILPAGCTASISAEFIKRNSWGAPVNPSGTGCSNTGMDSGDNLFINSTGGVISSQGSTMNVNVGTCGAYLTLGTYTTATASLMGGCNNSDGYVQMIVTGGSFTVGGTSNRSDEFVTYTITMSGTCGPNCNLVLPVDIASFSATAVDNGIEINWTAYSERDLKKYSVEKSTDGRSWQLLSEVIPTNEHYDVRHYSINDHEPAPGINYYKLSSHDMDGSIKIHPVTSAIYSHNSNLFQIQQDEEEIRIIASVNLTLSGLVLKDLAGRDIQIKPEHNGAHFRISKDLISKGTYILLAQDRPDLGGTKLIVY